MTWDEFVSNVRAWSTERGIYEHSTAVAQALKACSEAGELCDAVIKGDRAALIDSIGDICVCLVNTCHMLGDDSIRPPVNPWFDKSLIHNAGSVSLRCSQLAIDIEYGDVDSALSSASDAYFYLVSICIVECFDILECCESAWNEIKDRKGRMVAGGAFVKD